MKVNMSARMYGATPEIRSWYRQLRTEFGMDREMANLLCIVEMQRVQRTPPRRGRPPKRGPHVILRGPVP